MKQLYPSIKFFPYFIMLVVLNLQQIQAQQSVTNPKGNYIEQNIQYDPETTEDLSLQPSATGWGYSFDSLQNDILVWKQNPNIVIDTIGFSVQNRPLYELIITNKTSVPKTCRIAIHARTHPVEVQSTYVTKEMIKYLISGNANANELLDKYIFSIVPLYNPDGVELGDIKHNANGVDIEGGWDTFPQPEVIALKKLYKSYMDSPVLIRVALNMHSSVACARYFVFHHSNGTSLKYSEIEKKFIADVQKYFPGGFQNWDYYVSWTKGTPVVYPESWFWFNYNDSVIALTYEDMNCAGAGKYDSTAIALLGGVNDYLDANPVSIRDYQISSAQNNQSFVVFPNPVRTGSLVNIQFKDRSLKIYKVDLFYINGSKIQTFKPLVKGNQIHILLPDLKSGIYFLNVLGPDYSHREKFIVE